MEAKIRVQKLATEHCRNIVEWNKGKDKAFLEQWGVTSYQYPITEEQIEKRILEGNRIFEFVLEEKLLGTIELLEIEENRSGYAGRYLLNPEYQGKGYGVACIKAFAEYCYEELDLQEIHLRVFEFNKGARHCYEKAGFCTIGEFVGINDWKGYIVSLPSKDFILTSQRVRMNPLKSRLEDFKIEDIAHALSLMTRANGHFPEFYSVGQHCIACCKEAMGRDYENRLVLACLLHDGAEAYLSDITRPVKKHLDFYRETEERVLSQIYEKFLGADLTEQEAVLVKEIDDAMLYHEFLHYMDVLMAPTEPELKTKPEFFEKAFAEVEKEYLELYSLLSGKI